MDERTRWIFEYRVDDINEDYIREVYGTADAPARRRDVERRWRRLIDADIEATVAAYEEGKS